MSTVPKDFACPACLYPLSGVGAPCPECGRLVLQEDADHFARRNVFVELTKTSGILLIVFSLLLSLVGPGVLALLPVILVTIASVVVGRSAPGIFGTILRRAWLRCALWLILPWYIFGVLFFVGIFRGTIGLSSFSFSSSSFRSILFLGISVALIAGICVPVVLLACALMWRWQWRRTCRIAALPAEYTKTKTVRRAFGYSFVAPASIVVLIALIIAVPKFMDTFFPGWDLP